MTKSQVKAQFGANAGKYATSPVHASGASLARLVEVVAPQSHWRALDVAAAAGHTALAFAPHVAEVIASDITPQMLAESAKLAAERGIDNLTTAEADAEQLPFDDASFDLVTCRIAPHHFPDIPAFISESQRVLKPGGTFAVVDNVAPDRHCPGGDTTFTEAELQDAATVYNAFEKLRDPSHHKALTLDAWLAAITAAGFEIQHHELISKNMEFQPWADRLGASPATQDYLRAILTTSPPALKACLKPRHGDEGKLYFSLTECLITARRQ